MPGADKIIAECKADGTDPAQAAVRIVQHMRTAQAGQGAAALENIRGAEAGMVPPASAEAAGENPAQDAEAALRANLEAVRKSGAIR